MSMPDLTSNTYECHKRRSSDGSDSYKSRVITYSIPMSLAPRSLESYTRHWRTSLSFIVVNIGPSLFKTSILKPGWPITYWHGYSSDLSRQTDEDHLHRRERHWNVHIYIFIGSKSCNKLDNSVWCVNKIWTYLRYCCYRGQHRVFRRDWLTQALVHYCCCLLHGSIKLAGCLVATGAEHRSIRQAPFKYIRMIISPHLQLPLYNNLVAHALSQIAFRLWRILQALRHSHCTHPITIITWKRNLVVTGETQSLEIAASSK